MPSPTSSISSIYYIRDAVWSLRPFIVRHSQEPITINRYHGILFPRVRMLPQRSSRIYRDLKAIREDPNCVYRLSSENIDENIDRIKVGMKLVQYEFFMLEFDAPIESAYHPRTFTVNIEFPQRCR